MTRTKAFREGIEFAFDRARRVLADFDQQLESAQEGALAVPQRTYPPATRGRIDRLRVPARWIFEEVLDAMQDAEEMGGPEGQQYIDLMTMIAEEASARANAAIAMANAEMP